jgi:hypothetical protein
MKKLVLSFIIAGSLILVSCKKEDNSGRFSLLTTPTWVSDSLLADGVDASGPGEMLEKFKGDAKFNTDGTGVFGQYPGTWSLAYNDTEINIDSDSLLLPLTAQIEELTKVSLKINTGFPNALNPQQSIKIRLTFKSK